MLPLIVDKGFRSLIPPLRPDERAGLEANLEAEGCRDPLVVWSKSDPVTGGHILLDGHNRFEICYAKGIRFRIVERDFPDRDAATLWIVQNQLARRNLNESQRAMLAARIKPLFEAEAKKRQATSTGGAKPRPSVNLREAGQGNGKASEEAAAVVNVSASSVEAASKVLKAGIPELAAEVDAGRVAVSTAVAIATLPAEEQRTVVARNEAAILAEAKRIRAERATAAAAKRTERKWAEMVAAAASVGGSGKPKDSTWEIVADDCLERLAKVPAGSVRLAFADPPYNLGIDYGPHYDDDRPAAEYIDWCVEWLSLVRRALAPDGSLWLLINWEWYAQLALEAEDGLFHVRQTITWYESFGVNTARMYNRTSRPLLWCVKDSKRFVFNEYAPEIRRPSDRQEKYNDPRAVPDGKLWDDVWGVNPPIPRLTGTCNERIPGFPTQLPLALLRPIIACASGPGDLVLDPFCGSGTTGVICVELGRKFLGIELSTEYAETARLRLAAAEVGIQRESRDRDPEGKGQ